MDQPKIERLLRLMKMLTSNNKYTVEDLSSMLNTSPRSIYRYIDTFKEAGFVVKKIDGFIKLDKQSPYFKDISQLVHFTDEEAYIVHKAIESVDENNSIKQNLKAKLASVYNYKLLADCVVRKEISSNVHNLIEAIENKKQVKLHNYVSAHSKLISTRIIEPISFTTNYIQIWGYQLGQNNNSSNKMFKISRIGEVEILDKSWEHEKDHLPAKIDLFRITGNNLYPIDLRLGIRATALLKEEFPLAEKDLREENISGNLFWRLKIEVCSYEGVGRFVLGLLDDIEVIGNNEFKLFLKERIKMASF